MTLDEVPQRTAVRVSTLTMSATDQQRLTELGIRHGARVEVLQRAPFGGPLTLRVADGGLLALRRVQATRIVVVEEDVRA